MEAPLPNRTLYIRNLPEKLTKKRLRHLLHAAFSTHGRVVWIVNEKTLKLRGQAFITFEQQAGATSALRALHSSDFLGRVISVAYARTLSDRAASRKLGGSDDTTRKNRALKRRAEKKKKMIAAATASAPATATTTSTGIMTHADDTSAVPVASTGTTSATAPTETAPPPVVIVPNKILFVQGVTTTESTSVGDKLSEMFARFSGFVEVRAVPGKDDMAFVEFASETDAAVAMSGLDGHAVGNPPKPINVTFAKK